MTISKLFGSTNLTLLNNMGKTNKKLKSTFNSLASGQLDLISSNPAQAALASGLKSQVNSLNKINQGIQVTQLALNTASGALQGTADLLQDVRALALQASNGTLGTAERAAINNEAQELLQEVDSISQNTSFNGVKLLDGSFSQNVVVSEGSSKSVSVASSSLSSLGLSDIDLSTAGGAQDALEAIDNAIAQNIENQVRIGASQSALDFSSSSNAITAENLTAAYSAVADTDFAQATADLNSLKIQSQAQIALLNVQNQLFKDLSNSLMKNINGKK
jgi:flagellin